MQIPDPGYAGTNFEICQDHDEVDWIDFWDECEYVDDEYWDSGPIGTSTSKSSGKRKREDHVTESLAAKRRRIMMEKIENVQFVSMAKRLERFYELPPKLGDVKPFALLPNWKERFAKDTGVFEKKAMPEAMKKAAEAQDEETTPKQRQYDAFAQDEEEEWVDEDEADEVDGEAGDMVAQLASLDPEALKAVLKQKLGDAGLENLDEGTMMSALAKMLSGNQEAENAIDHLADNLLGQATQGNYAALSGWLSEQGVSLEDAEEDDASSVATAELPTASREVMSSNVEVSPPDSAIEVAKKIGDTKQIAIHGSSPSASAKKRTAPADSDDEAVTKRKRVTFDVPASSQSAQNTVVENGDAETSTIGMTLGTDTNIEQTRNEDRLEPDAMINSITARSGAQAASPKTANESAFKGNASVSTKSDGAKNYAKPTAAAAAKQARKRKAEDDAEDVENVAPAARSKRPARKATKSERLVSEAEPPARRTRSARAKAGK